MFFREKRTTGGSLLQLVESRRDSKGKVRQHVVVSLGGCPVPDEFRKAVAIEVTQRMAGYQSFLPGDPTVAEWTKLVLERIEKKGKLPGAGYVETELGTRGKFEEVDPDEVGHEDGVELGPSLVLLQAWRALGLDDYLCELKFSSEQIAAAKVSVFNRLIEACSENELVNWAQTTALDELLNVQTGAWGEDRFYRISDKLLSACNGLQKHLRERERDLFNLDRTILLYDLTNSYFEGACKSNELARRSVNSKEKRSDCPLISVGIVLDAQGFIITHKVFSGNTSDCRTLLGAVADLEKIAAGGKPVVVVDGGMATEDNLKCLRERGYDYVVNGKRQKRAEFAEDFLDKSCFKRVEGRADDKCKQPVFVRRIQVDGETVILCRSDGRRDKEDAIQDNAESKLIEGLETLQARILRKDPRLKLDEGPALVNRAVGRLVGRTTRASKLYDIDYDPGKQTMSWSRRQEQWDKNRKLHGCYCLRSSLDLSDQELWRLYITLTRVEDAFRNMKSDLGLRPFHHQLERRCRAHIWITILAYHLLRWTEYSLQLAGYSCTWRTLRRRLQTHCYATLIIPTKSGTVYQSRKPGRPNEVQRLIYTLLGIDWKSLPVRKRIYYKKSHCAKT